MGDCSPLTSGGVEIEGSLTFWPLLQCSFFCAKAKSIFLPCETFTSKRQKNWDGGLSQWGRGGNKQAEKLRWNGKKKGEGKLWERKEGEKGTGFGIQSKLRRKFETAPCCILTPRSQNVLLQRRQTSGDWCPDGTNRLGFSFFISGYSERENHSGCKH